MAKRETKSRRASSRRTGTQLTEALRRAAMAEDDDELDGAEDSFDSESSADDDSADDDSSDGAASDDSPDGADGEEPTYRIGEVAQLVGVDAHVLRYWESEFRLKPERSPSGQRLYRKDDLAVFLRVKSLLHDEGYTIAGARRVLERGESTSPGLDVDRLKAAIAQVTTLRRTIRALQDDIELDQRY